MTITSFSMCFRCWHRIIWTHLRCVNENNNNNEEKWFFEMLYSCFTICFARSLSTARHHFAGHHLICCCIWLILTHKHHNLLGVANGFFTVFNYSTLFAVIRPLLTRNDEKNEIKMEKTATKTISSSHIK